MAFADFRPRHQTAHGARDIDLTRVTAERVDLSTSGSVDPMIASVESEAVTMEPIAKRAVNNLISALAAENCVPLINARPSSAPKRPASNPPSRAPRRRAWSRHRKPPRPRRS